MCSEVKALQLKTKVNLSVVKVKRRRESTEMFNRMTSSFLHLSFNTRKYSRAYLGLDIQWQGTAWHDKGFNVDFLCAQEDPSLLLD